MTNYSIRSSNQNFNCIYDLVDYVLENGICPSSEITKNGEKTGEFVSDFLQE